MDAYAIVGDNVQKPNENVINSYIYFLDELDYVGLLAKNPDIKNIAFTAGSYKALNNNFNNIGKISAYIQINEPENYVYDATVSLPLNNNLSHLALVKHPKIAYGAPILKSDIANNKLHKGLQTIQTNDSSAKYLTKVIIEKSVQTQKTDYAYVFSSDKPTKNSSCFAYEYHPDQNSFKKLDDSFSCF